MCDFLITPCELRFIVSHSSPKLQHTRSYFRVSSDIVFFAYFFSLVGIWVYIETFVFSLGFNFRALSVLPSDKAALMTTGRKLFFYICFATLSTNHQ